MNRRFPVLFWNTAMGSLAGAPSLRALIPTRHCDKVARHVVSDHEASVWYFLILCCTEDKADVVCYIFSRVLDLLCAEEVRGSL